MFFLQIGSYQITLKLWYSTRRRTETPLPHRFWPILSNIIFVKIDPCGILFANIIVPCGDFGDVVARGYYLRVKLRRRNREFGAPKGWKLTPSYQKTCDDNDTSISLAISSISLRQGKVTSQSKDAHPPPKTPHISPSIFYRAWGGVEPPQSERAGQTRKRTIWRHVVAPPIPNRTSHFPSWD
jgi:hypothetical protein